MSTKNPKDKPEIIHVDIPPEFILCNVEYEDCDDNSTENAKNKKNASQKPPKYNFICNLLFICLILPHIVDFL